METWNVPAERHGRVQGAQREMWKAEDTLVNFTPGHPEVSVHLVDLRRESRSRCSLPNLPWIAWNLWLIVLLNNDSVEVLIVQKASSRTSVSHRATGSHCCCWQRSLTDVLLLNGCLISQSYISRAIFLYISVSPPQNLLKQHYAVFPSIPTLMVSDIFS